MARRGFNGLIQHSFALETDKSRAPFRGETVAEMVAERFVPNETGNADFKLSEIGGPGTVPVASSSALFEHELTTLDPKKKTKFFEWNRGKHEYTRDLPGAVSWANRAGSGERERGRDDHWERAVFAKKENGSLRATPNDLLVQAVHSREDQACAVSEMLSELLAVRRSMLFGLALANRFVNVTLPHALLTPAPSDACDPQSGGASADRRAMPWILQPLVSLIRVGHDGDDFRSTYSLSFFLIPVESSCCEPRRMRKHEIQAMVNAGWGLAAYPFGLPEFDLSGPLLNYLAQLSPPVAEVVRPLGQSGKAGDCDRSAGWSSLTLRKATEAIAFGVALRMARGPYGQVDRKVGREIGDGVVTALGNSRVSSAVVVDDDFDRGELEDPRVAFPGKLGPLMKTLAGEVRVPEGANAAGPCRYRLDRPYIDHGDFAIGVLPSNRCLVVTTDPETQDGREDSALMQAGWIAYTAIGATSAIGTMRSINGALETVDRSSPKQIAKLEHEVAVDLHELYDLDITWEAYRVRYRHLRKQLGITSDYQALRGKLEALYRESSANFEAKNQRWLILLTAVIAFFSVVLVVIEVAFK